VELEYEVIEGKRVFEGDILLPAPRQSIANGPQPKSAGIVESQLGRRWPYGIVWVEDSGLARDPRVIQAMQHWQDRTSIRFIFATEGHRVRFVVPADNKACSSHIGMQDAIDAQEVNLGANCITGQAIHEIGHAIGLFHEQSRTDRANYVIVNDGTNGTTNCILPNEEYNFETFGNNGLNLGAYDLGSIMHYGSTDFLDRTITGCTATITRLDGTLIDPNRTGLSGGDIAGAQSLYLSWTNVRRAVDYDFDGKADIAVWRPSTGEWFVSPSSTGQPFAVQWGFATDIPVQADYNGDGRADLAVWRPSDGNWYIAGSPVVQQWGFATDIPVPADYNGDGRADLAVWRPSDGNWYISITGGSTRVQQWGGVGDIPVPADYDGDRLTDFAVWRPSEGNWYILNSRDSSIVKKQWGNPSDVPVPADYDGDGLTDIAVWRPSTGEWFVSPSSTGQPFVVQWGFITDIPVQADYDGDGVTDLAVWRPSDGNWYIRSNTVAAKQWGGFADVPVQ
jgi:hypothetical protein